MNIAIIIVLILSIFATGKLTINDDFEFSINWFAFIALILCLIKFYF